MWRRTLLGGSLIVPFTLATRKPDLLGAANAPSNAIEVA